jgi:4a-hydroxytetrahydrobiopterin dehydratase
MEDLLNKSAIESALKSMPGWAEKEDSITKTFTRKDFIAAMAFVTKVAIISERADHHPDIDIRWNKITITLSTHSMNGLTKKDFHLAKEIDAL